MGRRRSLFGYLRSRRARSRADDHSAGDQQRAGEALADESVGVEPVADPIPLRIAWLDQDMIGAQPWTNGHAHGRDVVQDQFGDRVVTRYIERVDPRSDLDVLVGRLVDEGFDLIFATSQPFSEPITAVARQFPETTFSVARGFDVLDNLATFWSADEEALYLAGMLAAGVTTTQLIGFVGTVPEPETLRHLNAFTLGARRVDPSVVVYIRWMRRWWDTETEILLAEELAEAGADVLVSGSVSTVVGEVARRVGCRWVGHDADHSVAFDDVWVAAAVPRWERYYMAQVDDHLSGRWRPRRYVGHMSDGFVTLSSIGRGVPDHVLGMVEDVRTALGRGRFDPFDGPLSDTSGVVRVPAGSTLDPQARRNMDWYVTGVVSDQ